MKFGTILADPPWHFPRWGEGIAERSASYHYPTQGTDWIASLPVQAVAARDCTLLLWVTNPHLPDGLRVLEAWGFRYCSTVTWVKMSRAAAPRVGLGFHVRACTEPLLIATRGTSRAPKPSDRPLGAIFCPRGEHSAKPDFQYSIAEAYAGPYLEMFHRPRDGGLFGPRPGWTFTGDAVDGLDMREALERLAVLPEPGARVEVVA